VLRALVLALALANVVFWAWTQGWLDPFTSIPAHGDREPERLARQVRPEAIVILPPGGSASAPVAVAPVCLEAGPFDAAGRAAAEAALAAAQPPFPAGTWSDVTTTTAGSWLVYMGRFANREALDRKLEELKRYRTLDFQEVSQPPELAPGLSLGQYGEREAADAALERLVARGIRTARVVESEPPVTSHRLRVEAAGAELAARLTGLRADALGAGFGPCGAAAR
jgi:hypothetical protein